MLYHIYIETTHGVKEMMLSTQRCKKYDEITTFKQWPRFGVKMSYWSNFILDWEFNYAATLWNVELSKKKSVAASFVADHLSHKVNHVQGYKLIKNFSDLNEICANYSFALNP